MDKIDINEKDAELLADSLKELLGRLRSDKVALEQQIKQVEGNLTLVIAGHKKETITGGGKPRKRRKYGQNPKQIRRFLNAHPDQSFSTDDIAIQLNLPRSSAYGTLKRFRDKGVVQLVNGLWRKKTS